MDVRVRVSWILQLLYYDDYYLWDPQQSKMLWSRGLHPLQIQMKTRENTPAEKKKKKNWEEVEEEEEEEEEEKEEEESMASGWLKQASVE